MTISPVRGGYIYGPSAAYRCSPPQARTRSGDGRVDVAGACDGGPYDAYCPSNIESPLMPPWRTLPWPKRCDASVAIAAVSVLQAARQTTDARGVGRTLDLFV